MTTFKPITRIIRHVILPHIRLEDTHVKVLADLSTSPDTYHDVSHVPNRRLKKLILNDLIVYSPREKLACLTNRGKRLCNQINAIPVLHFDDICPRCRTNPKHIYKGGVKCGYCIDCLNESHRKAYKIKGRQIVRDAMCNKCHTKPRAISAGGIPYALCADCKRKENTARAKKYKQEVFLRAKNGKTVLCVTCKTKPIVLYKNSAEIRCRECHNERKRKLYATWREKNPPKRGLSKLERAKLGEIFMCRTCGERPCYHSDTRIFLDCQHCIYVRQQAWKKARQSNKQSKSCE